MPKDIKKDPVAFIKKEMKAKSGLGVACGWILSAKPALLKFMSERDKWAEACTGLRDNLSGAHPVQASSTKSFLPRLDAPPLRFRAA